MSVAEGMSFATTTKIVDPVSNPTKRYDQLPMAVRILRRLTEGSTVMAPALLTVEGFHFSNTPNPTGCSQASRLNGGDGLMRSSALSRPDSPSLGRGQHHRGCHHASQNLVEQPAVSGNARRPPSVRVAEQSVGHSIQRLLLCRSRAETPSSG